MKYTSTFRLYNLNFSFRQVYDFSLNQSAYQPLAFAKGESIDKFGHKSPFSKGARAQLSSVETASATLSIGCSIFLICRIIPMSG